MLGNGLSYSCGCINNMTTRYRLIYRGHQVGMFYCVDKTTGKRTSLKTTNRDAAQQIIEAKNQSEHASPCSTCKSPRRIWQEPTTALPRTWQTGSRGGCFCEQRSGLYWLLALDSASAITGFIELCSWAQSR